MQVPHLKARKYSDRRTTASLFYKGTVTPNTVLDEWSLAHPLRTFHLPGKLTVCMNHDRDATLVAQERLCEKLCAREEEDTAVAHHSAMNMSTEDKWPPLHKHWDSVVDSGLMWPGEYQSAVDTCGDPHQPWGVNPNYFECCTGTPYADNTRASVFLLVTSDASPVKIAMDLRERAPLRRMALQIQVGNEIKRGALVYGSSSLHGSNVPLSPHHNAKFFIASGTSIRWILACQV